jgi:NAD(P)-dependent dehydrogenase (short-subunit alcohol dehydrogenase family)
MNQRRVAMITGASRGIGRGIAIELAKSGFDIAGVSRSANSNEIKTEIEKSEARFLHVQGDVSILDDHEKMISLALKQFGRIDVLVNNAGVAPEKRLDILETNEESFDRVLNINLRGPFFLTQKVAAQMIKQRDAVEAHQSIVFITSVSAYMSSPNRAEYCVSKAGLSMAAAVFADRLSAESINVYEVRPGIIKTDMTSGVEEKYDKLIDEGLIPQHRWGTPEDVGKAVSSLVSGAFNYSTGTVIEVSGGMNIRKL